MDRLSDDVVWRLLSGVSAPDLLRTRTVCRAWWRASMRRPFGLVDLCADRVRLESAFRLATLRGYVTHDGDPTWERCAPTAGRALMTILGHPRCTRRDHYACSNAEEFNCTIISTLIRSHIPTREQIELRRTSMIASDEALRHLADTRRSVMQAMREQERALSERRTELSNEHRSLIRESRRLHKLAHVIARL